MLSALAVQGLLEPLGDADRYGLAGHLKKSERLVSDQPGRPDTNLVTPLLTNLSDDQRKIIALCEAPQKQAHLMRQTVLSHRTFFRRKRLEPLIQAGLIRMTRPDEPNHPDQAYVVTAAAIPLLDAWRTDAGREEAP